MPTGSARTLVRMAVLALLWGSGFLWIKLALDGGLTPLQITVTRCALGAAVLLVLAYAARQRLPRGRRTWAHLVVAALFCNALPFFLFSVGEQTVDSGVAGVLNATTPLWSLLIGFALGSDRDVHPLRLTGLVLGFAGTLVIFAPWHQAGLTSWGALLLLAAAASYAVAFAYMARHLTGGPGGPLALSAAQLLAATGLTALALPAGGTGPSTPTLTAIVAVIVLGTLGTGITFHLNARLIADEGPVTAATVGYLLPVVSVALGAIVLDEQLSLRIIAGMAVVLLGVGLTRTGRNGSASRPAPASTPSAPRTDGSCSPTHPGGSPTSACSSPQAPSASSAPTPGTSPYR
ncbi:drug/metabolite transporter (DMT)-like permease [Micromonospora pisi]|uniref:Drug/metabolite transporter (DMT)-like permease n=1 Tax=Micromonospora pisi TaxID=589240 RepID=A0A495JPX3_9ACTN|nr:DMT family transporter [Micromonospora pisi]RKR90422.1 drug/metabolite transporter (DMT)-like permease [Micromonospora pisi]